MSDTLFNKGYRYEIFIGIKDKDTYEELLTVEDLYRFFQRSVQKKKSVSHY